jgi:hypothetical protein
MVKGPVVVVVKLLAKMVRQQCGSLLKLVTI